MIELSELAKFKISCRMGYLNSVFRNPCKALEAAYGAIAYARFQMLNDKTAISFLTNKTKLAPLRKKKVILLTLELLSYFSLHEESVVHFTGPQGFKPVQKKARHQLTSSLARRAG